MLDDYLPDFAFLSALISETMHEHNNDDKNETTNKTIKEPKTFQEAWSHPNLDQQQKWREAIKKELKDMINEAYFERRNDQPCQQENDVSRTNGYSRSKEMEYSELDL